MMKKSLQNILLINVLLFFCTSAFAWSDSAIIDIDISPDFAGKKISFLTELVDPGTDIQYIAVTKQEIGDLPKKSIVIRPVEYTKNGYSLLQIEVYVAGMREGHYESKKYSLKPGTHIELNFPSMFYRI
jgi:hypothetical protein